MSPHLRALLLQLMRDEEPIDGAVGTAETALTFRKKSLFQVAVEAIEEDAGEDFPGDAEHRDSSVGIVDLAVPIFRVEVDGCVIPELTRNLSLTPFVLEQRCELMHKLGATMLVNLSRDGIRSRCFPAGELLHSPNCFLERGQKIEVGVSFHFRQSVDGGIRDCGQPVENASEVLGPALQLPHSPLTRL
ncbi:unnamed protein product [Schistocephalus solidus]|uniref:FHA domain-containing protein n=1 Tax=Schistocephalus solidus TaxID=70667 RepID=A0A183TJT0_SCHSO|nr:unnamed protein product [Schistocephalus solidus]